MESMFLFLSRRIPIAALLFCFSASLYLLVGRGMVVSHDAFMMLKTTEAIVERGTFELIESEHTNDTTAAKGLEGKVYSIYGIGKSLVNIPAYVIGKFLEGSLPQLPKDAGVHFCVSLVNPLVSAGVVVSLFLMCTTFGFNQGESVSLSLLYGFASIALPYSKDDMSEPLAAFFVTAGLTAVIRLQVAPSTRLAVIAALTLGAGVATRHVVAIVPFICAGLLLISFRNSGKPRMVHLLWFFGLLGAMACLLFWFNYARFGSITETGYDKAGGGTRGFTFLSLSFPLHCLAYFISPGYGLLAYMPFLFIVPLGIPKLWLQKPFPTVVLLACFTANLSLVAAYRFWDGSWGWGPRFLLVFLPLLFPFFGMGYRLISAFRPLRLLVLFLCLVAFVINLVATIAPWERYLTKVALEAGSGKKVDWAWSLSDCQIANQFPVFWDVYTLPAESRNQLSNGQRDLESALTSSRSLNLPSIWPVRLAYEGIPVAAILAASGFLVLMASVSGALIWFRFRPNGSAVPCESVKS
jgi:hypothetical protein